jgi:hypothetical protein
MSISSDGASVRAFLGPVIGPGIHIGRRGRSTVVVILYIRPYSQRPVRTGRPGGDLTVDLTHVARSVLFGNFSKSDSKPGTVHAGVDAFEQARTCAGSSVAMLQEFES